VHLEFLMRYPPVQPDLSIIASSILLAQHRELVCNFS
jgi:hypothetical protein